MVARATCCTLYILGAARKWHELELTQRCGSAGGMVRATCNRGYTLDTVSLQPVVLFYMSCQQNCRFAEPPKCQPISCGTFALPAGLESAGWSPERVYVHSDKIKLVCLASHRVLGTACQSSRDVICDEGHFKRMDGSTAAFRPCEAVNCLDGAACHACPAYSPNYGDDKVVSWEPRTQRVHGETVEVRCKEGYHASIVPLQDSVFENYNCSRNESIAIAAARVLNKYPL
jgi:hypothetical protein